MSVQENRQKWLRFAEEHRDLMEGRVQRDIETYRKGNCRLRITDKGGKPLAGKQVQVTQRTHDFGVGANIFMLDEFPEEEHNALYREAFKEYFNLATVPFYWDTLEPEQGKPRYDKDSPKVYRRPAPDRCVEYCQQNGVAPKLHCLVYEQFTPDWLPKGDMAAMEALYEERVRQIAQRYAGRMLEFEVVNELLCEAGWTNQTVISDKRDIVEWAFALARKYLPEACLVFNEGNPILGLARDDYRNAYYMLVENALLKGASIDKIGLQHHAFTGATAQTPEAYEKAVADAWDSPMFDPKRLLEGLDVIATLGKPLEITEITIPTFGDTPEDEELQADLLEVLYTVCFSHPAMEGLVYWNLPDGYAFNPGNRNWNENQCRGGLFHHDMTPKASARRLHDLFHKTWHTELTLTTDEEGWVDLRGFYGDYIAQVDGEERAFGIHKSGCNRAEIVV